MSINELPLQQQPPVAALCVYCFGARYMTRVRACCCQQPGHRGAHDDGCDEGWIYVKERCWCQETQR